MSVVKIKYGHFILAVQKLRIDCEQRPMATITADTGDLKNKLQSKKVFMVVPSDEQLGLLEPAKMAKGRVCLFFYFCCQLTGVFASEQSVRRSFELYRAFLKASSPPFLPSTILLH